MGTVRKIGDEYYIEFYARGLLYQQKGGKDKERAERLLQKVESKIQDGEMGIVVRDVDLKIFIQTFMDYVTKIHSTRTVQRYQVLLKHFQDFLGNNLPKIQRLSSITPHVMEQYQSALLQDSYQEKRISPQIINFTFLLLKDVFDYAITLGYLNDNPTFHLRELPVANQKIVATVSDELLEAIKGAVADKLKTIVLILINTGLRISEIFSLQCKDVDLTNRRLTINKESNKIKRTLPISEDLVDALSILISSRHSSEFLFSEKISELKINKELQKWSVTTVMLRNTFVLNLLTRKISLNKISQILGLSDIMRIMAYASLKRKVSTAI